MSQVETAFDEMVLDQVVEQKNLIVFNDHVNSFDHVIESLVKVCKHDMIQAEQCTWLVHQNLKKPKVLLKVIDHLYINYVR
mgnify:CR=1 FL=1